MGWIRRLLFALFPPRPTEAIVQVATPDALAKLVSPRTMLVDGLEICAFLPYRHETVHACIVEAKFHGNEQAQRLLGSALASYMHSQNENTEFILIPIPLSSARRKSRGYNQVERSASYAVPALAGTAILSPHLLERVRDTTPQTSLNGAERRKNLIGAFRAAEPLDPLKNYVLLDDVATTGATLSAAAKALHAAGATQVRALALSY